MTDKQKMPNFEDMSAAELKDQLGKLKAAVKMKQEAGKQAALRRVVKIVQDNDLEFEEVKRTIRTAAKRGKAPALYRNPDNIRQTWSGQGKAPDWYRNHPNPESLKLL